MLIVRVHSELLRSQKLPAGSIARQAIWEERYRSIVDLEAHLHRNGTRIIKFFLHLSKDEQRKRFIARIDEPDKNWKLSLGDVRKRKHWKDYMEAYEACLAATTTEHAPWYVVPADDKKNARLIVSHIILETMKGLYASCQPHLPGSRNGLISCRDDRSGTARRTRVRASRPAD